MVRVVQCFLWLECGLTDVTLQLYSLWLEWFSVSYGWSVVLRHATVILPVVRVVQCFLWLECGLTDVTLQSFGLWLKCGLTLRYRHTPCVWSMVLITLWLERCLSPQYRHIPSSSARRSLYILLILCMSLA